MILFAFTDCSVHDARMLQESGLCDPLADNQLYDSKQFHLLGDVAYLLLPSLLMPFWDNGHLTPQQISYNTIHSSAWCTVGRTIMQKGASDSHRKFVSDPFCYVSGAGKGFASVNVLAVCDNKMRFTCVYAARAGSVHDAHVLRVSSLANMLETSAWPSSGENSLHLLGDSAYTLLPNLLVPIHSSHIGTTDISEKIQRIT